MGIRILFKEDNTKNNDLSTYDTQIYKFTSVAASVFFLSREIASRIKTPSIAPNCLRSADAENNTRYIIRDVEREAKGKTPTPPPRI